MIPLFIFIPAIQFRGGPKQWAKDQPQVMRFGMRETVRFWHKFLLSKHFQTGAAEKYGYKKRSAKYMARKARKGVLAPLVFTGRARRELTRFIDIRGGPLRATGRMAAPNYIRIRPRDGKNRPNLVREILETTQQEAKAMGSLLASYITDSMNKSNKKETVTLGR